MAYYCDIEVEVGIHYGLVAYVNFHTEYWIEPYDPGSWSCPPSGGGVCDICWDAGIITDIIDEGGHSLLFSLNEKERRAILKMAEHKLEKIAQDECEDDYRNNKCGPRD